MTSVTIITSRRTERFIRAIRSRSLELIPVITMPTASASLLRGWSGCRCPSCRHPHASAEGSDAKASEESLYRLSRSRDSGSSRSPRCSQGVSIFQCQEVAHLHPFPHIILHTLLILSFSLPNLMSRIRLGLFDKICVFLGIEKATIFLRYKSQQVL